MSKKFNVIVADCPWPFKDTLKMSDVKRSALSNYDVMTIADIKNLPIKDYADPNGAILALWVPSSLLQEGLDTMNAWGFKHKQTYVWVKTKKAPLKEVATHFFKYLKIGKKKINKVKPKELSLYKTSLERVMELLNPDNSTGLLNKMLAFGMGRLFRQTHELCLIGTSNNRIYKELANKSQRSVSLAENLKHSAKPEHLQDSLDIMFPKGQKLELFARRLRPGWTCLGNEVCNGEDIKDSLIKL